jgi:hypothetical protein
MHRSANPAMRASVQEESVTPTVYAESGSRVKLAKDAGSKR